MLCDELSVVSSLDYPSVLQHHDGVGVADGREPVSDDKYCPALHKGVHALFDKGFCTSIDGACSLIENEYLRLFEKRTGNVSIASQTYTPNINIGNKTDNNFSSPALQTFEFDITEQGDYVIAIYSAASEWSDAIIGQMYIMNNSYVATGIHTTQASQEGNERIYNLQGQNIRSLSQQKPGIYISNGKKIIKR